MRSVLINLKITKQDITYSYAGKERNACTTRRGSDRLKVCGSHDSVVVRISYIKLYKYSGINNSAMICCFGYMWSCHFKLNYKDNIGEDFPLNLNQPNMYNMVCVRAVVCLPFILLKLSEIIVLQS